jgi:hypothetical protein
MRTEKELRKKLKELTKMHIKYQKQATKEYCKKNADDDIIEELESYVFSIGSEIYLLQWVLNEVEG